MKVSIELEQLAAIERTLADIPKAPPIEQWGLVFVCYNTIKQIRAEATANAMPAKEE